MNLTKPRCAPLTGIVIACVSAFAAGRIDADTSAPPDVSTPEAVLKASNHAELIGDAKTLRAMTYYTAAWEKVMAADIERGAVRAKLTQTVTDKWGVAGLHYFFFLQEPPPFPDNVTKISGDTAVIVSSKYPDMPPMGRFKKVGGQWKLDIVADTKPGEEDVRLAYYQAQTKVTADFTRQIVKGTLKTAKETGDLYSTVLREIYSAQGTDPAAIVTMANRYYFGFDIDKDRAAALPLYRRAANAGDADAMRSLGHYYEFGYEVPQDYAAAMSWYQKAAKAGNTSAGTDIGALYENGKGAAQDYGMALLWYRKGAAGGSAFATEQIGELYERGGHGIVQDYTQAVAWFKKAVALKDTDAMRHLAQMSESGQGLPQDHAEALRWYHMAASAGDEKSKKWLAAHPGE